MLDISTETVEKCRERNGAALEGRDDSIDNVLVSDTLAYNEGSPLVEGVDSYADYPSRKQLSNPEYGDFLRRLFSHELVGTWSDAVTELTSTTSESLLSDWIDAVEKAADLHNIDTESLFADSREEPDTAEVVSDILGYEVEGSMLDSNNPLLLSALYVEGLSDGEISEVLETDKTSVRDKLKSVGLLNGKTTDEQTAAFRQNHAEINRRTTSSTVDMSAAEESDSITVVSR